MLTPSLLAYSGTSIVKLVFPDRKRDNLDSKGLAPLSGTNYQRQIYRVGSMRDTLIFSSIDEAQNHISS